MMSILCDRIMKGFENMKGTFNHPPPPSPNPAFPVAGAKKLGMNRVKWVLYRKILQQGVQKCDWIRFCKRTLKNKPKTSKNILPFVTTFNPATPNLKKILMKHRHLITGNNTLEQIYPKAPIATYWKEKSLKDSLTPLKA